MSNHIPRAADIDRSVADTPEKKLIFRMVERALMDLTLPITRSTYAIHRINHVTLRDKKSAWDFFCSGECEALLDSIGFNVAGMTNHFRRYYVRYWDDNQRVH